MSDITKKIYSIEPEGMPVSSEPKIADVIRPVLEDRGDLRGETSQEDVPKFVTREAIQPRNAPPQMLPLDNDENTGAAGWLILGFGVLYFIGAGLYFGLPLFKESPELLSVAGLVLLLSLPLILLLLLWRSLRHLNSVSQENARYAKAAEILVTPDSEALVRTETLASGIRTEIAQVNTKLADTVEALKEVQVSVTRESQALDAAGLQLSSRSEDVGRNLTLQRQALESISGTFDTRMSTLSSQISETSQTLETICETAESKLLKAGESLQIASGMMDQTITDSSDRINERITEIREVSRKLDETGAALASDLALSTEQLSVSEEALFEKVKGLQHLNAETQAKISELQETIGTGSQVLGQLQNAADERASSLQSYYANLRSQLQQSEDETLATQGKTARLVEANMAQMRQDFSALETDLQALQLKLKDLRTSTPTSTKSVAQPTYKFSGLNLMPLDSDFPPVEPPRPTPSNAAPKVEPTLDLGMHMEVETPDSLISKPVIPDTAIPNYEPDVIRRPGEAVPSGKSKGFGRRSEKEDRSSWRWRDMLGGLERPDAALPVIDETPLEAPALAVTPVASPLKVVDGVALLTKIQLSPSAIVDEGTVIDATQARINSGEVGLIRAVSGKLPEAVAHLKERMAYDPDLASDLQSFTSSFSKMIGNTPPTAPALRAALGSPDGRAYLLVVAALKG